jgi:hypothetical protein
VVLAASQIIKKSATASGILRKSREMISSPFFSCIAFMMALKIFEFLVNLAALLRLRVASIESCSNNQYFFYDTFESEPPPAAHPKIGIFWRSVTLLLN